MGWRDFFVGSDDSIRPCQSTSLKFGNLSDYDTFEDAWNAKAMQDFRANVNDNTGGGYAASVQVVLSKLTRKLEQKIKLYSNWNSICTRLGEEENLKSYFNLIKFSIQYLHISTKITSGVLYAK